MCACVCVCWNVFNWYFCTRRFCSRSYKKQEAGNLSQKKREESKQLQFCLPYTVWVPKRQTGLKIHTHTHTARVAHPEGSWACVSSSHSAIAPAVTPTAPSLTSGPSTAFWLPTGNCYLLHLGISCYFGASFTSVASQTSACDSYWLLNPEPKTYWHTPT